MNRPRLIRSLVLPLLVAGLVPFLLVAHYSPLRLEIHWPIPLLQIPLGLLFSLTGLVLLGQTIRLFAEVGQGTLAPWDPPRRLVTRGVYRYVRNPMISGVLAILLGEALLCGAWAILAWFGLVLAINTAYFKLSEEPGLVRRFGEEYLRYRRNVPMWLPRLTPWDAGVR
jgi:protein-S-isoprenylcysteine O-methyltransferase Ste14